MGCQPESCIALRLNQNNAALHIQCFHGVTCRRNLLAIRLSGETSDCLHVKQTCSSESSKAVLMPGKEHSAQLDCISKSQLDLKSSTVTSIIEASFAFCFPSYFILQIPCQQQPGFHSYYEQELTVIAVAVPTAGDHHSVRHQVVADGTQQLIWNGVCIVLGRRLVVRDERRPLLLSLCVRLPAGTGEWLGF